MRSGGAASCATRALKADSVWKLFPTDCIFYVLAILVFLTAPHLMRRITPHRASATQRTQNQRGRMRAEDRVNR
jgi:hypothetical protein